MNRAEDLVAASAVEIDRFHDIDLADGRPVAWISSRTDVVVVLRQHPEGRPKALARGELDAGFYAPVLERETIAGIDSGRREPEVSDPLAAGLDLEHAVFETGVVRQVILQLIVAPARNTVLAAVTGFEEPDLRVQLSAVEFVAPHEGQQITVRYRKGRRYVQDGVVDVDVDRGGRVGRRDIDRLYLR